MTSKWIIITLLGFFAAFSNSAWGAKKPRAIHRSCSVSNSVPPSPVSIQNVSVSGSGCPEGSAAIIISPDQTAFSVLLDQSIAQSDTQTPLTQKVCELTIVSKVPAGWKFNLHTTDFRGFSQVDPGSETFQRTSYYSLSQSQKWSLIRQSKKTFTPNFNDNYFIEHLLKTEQPRRVRCVDHLETIKVQVQLVARSNKKRTTSAQIALDSVDGIVEGTKEGVCSGT